MLTANKGEWSEVYALLKIIADKQLIVGDADLNKVEHLIHPIVKVLRDESNGTFEFTYEQQLVIVTSNENTVEIPLTEFHKNAVYLLQKLQGKTDRTFSIPVIEEFINSYGAGSIKASSSIKSDIRIVIHDQRTGMKPELGFSIKSQLGSPSTLLNASRATNFVFKVDTVKLSELQINAINSIVSKRKIQERIEKLAEQGGKLQFIGTESPVFNANLALIDSCLDTILAKMLILFYTTKLTKVKELVEQVNILNPLKFNSEFSHPFYEYKVKRFLTDVALGMMPSSVWTGQLDATGGYLVVKADGDVLCYHIYNRNEFEDYLFSNTRFETASSSRHKFGTVYKENEELYFKLNLQIRFV